MSYLFYLNFFFFFFFFFFIPKFFFIFSYTFVYSFFKSIIPNFEQLQCKPYFLNAIFTSYIRFFYVFPSLIKKSLKNPYYFSVICLSNFHFLYNDRFSFRTFHFTLTNCQQRNLFALLRSITKTNKRCFFFILLQKGARWPLTQITESITLHLNSDTVNFIKKILY